MDVQKIINYFESSFLKGLLEDKEITDITYNGEDFFYLHNLYGRQQAFFEINKDGVKDFVRQIANMSEKQFSYSNPVLDISFGKYRFNAVHQSIGKVNNVDAITFAIRIGSEELHIQRDNGSFPLAIAELIDTLVTSKASIVLGGLTGSGKTELQKYLITRMKKYVRIIVIDNVLELDIHSLGDSLDLNVWQADDKTPYSTIQFLVKNALRSNPDWLIVAESRGSEMIEVLNSAMTGHPIITTLHALDAKSMPNRMTRMVMMNEKKMSFDDVYADILYHFHIYFYMKRTIDKKGMVKRFISQIVEYKNNGDINVIYEKKKGKDVYHPLSEDTISLLEINDEFHEFKAKFMKGEVWKKYRFSIL